MYLNFMVVGHTKFSSDRHFGTIKNLSSRKGAQSILDLIGVEGIIKKKYINIQMNKSRAS